MSSVNMNWNSFDSLSIYITGEMMSFFNNQTFLSGSMGNICKYGIEKSTAN